MLCAVHRVSFSRLQLFLAVQLDVFSAVQRDKKIFTQTLTVSSDAHTNTHIYRTMHAHTHILILPPTHCIAGVTNSNSEVMSKVSALIQRNHSKGFALSEPHHMRVTLSSNFAGFPPFPPVPSSIYTFSLPPAELLNCQTID